MAVGDDALGFGFPGPEKAHNLPIWLIARQRRTASCGETSPVASLRPFRWSHSLEGLGYTLTGRHGLVAGHERFGGTNGGTVSLRKG